MKVLKNVSRGLLTISTPFVFLMLAVRILLTPLFLLVEYRTPNFPEDSYGFTQQDRLQWSRIAVQYLTNSEDIDFLQSQKIDNTTPLFNARELSHMEDVKILVSQMLNIWWILILVWLILLVWAWRGKWMKDYILSISNGGWFTLAIIATLLLLVFIDFDSLFTTFHQIFFQGDTWLFYYSDNLIRLFPMRFWRDAFIFTGGITLLLALLSAFSRNWIKKKQAV